MKTTPQKPNQPTQGNDSMDVYTFEEFLKKFAPQEVGNRPTREEKMAELFRAEFSKLSSRQNTKHDAK